MNILLVTDHLFPGGISRHVVDLANGLHHRGDHVSVAATPGPFRSMLHPEIPFVELSLRTAGSERKDVFGTFRSLRILRSFLRRNSVDIVHTHMRYSGFLAHHAMSDRKTAFVVSHHSLITDKKMFTLLGDRTIACSEAVRGSLVDRIGALPDHISVIYNGIHPRSTGVPQSDKNILPLSMIPPEKKVIATIARLVPEKGIVGIIRAVSLLRKRIDLSDLLFVILGEGEKKGEYQELIAAAEMKELIVLVNAPGGAEWLIERSEFLILNSTAREGFGIVLLEGARAGKMVIGTRVGGIPEFIDEGITGVLIDPDSPEQLAEQLAALIARPELYRTMGEAARNKYERYFTADRMVDSVAAVYRSVRSSG